MTIKNKAINNSKQTKGDSVIVVMPAYNEKGRIRKTIKDVQKYVDRIIVIDDGSTDNTVSALNDLDVIVLQHCVNLGQGASIQTGIDKAKQMNADIVITYDADGQFDAKDIPRMILPIRQDEADVVLGSRFLGRSIDMDMVKYTVLKLGVLFTRVFSKISLTDTHNGFRAMNKKAFHTVKITQDGMTHASEILDQLKRYKLRYVEVPVTVYYNDDTRKRQSMPSAISIATNYLFNKIK